MVMESFMNNKGSVLIVVIFVLAIITGLAFSLSRMITLNIKGISSQNKEFLNFENADGGIFAVAGWMYYYKRADVPKEVTNTESYSVHFSLLGNTNRYPIGYSTSWKGFDTRINSQSNATEVESVVFIPVAPAGYGNE
jgi:hypothetical protein